MCFGLKPPGRPGRTATRICDPIPAAGRDRQAMVTNLQGATALLAVSHSAVEHALYEALRSAARGEDSSIVRGVSLVRLLEVTGLGGYATLRRGRAGVVAKLSDECRRSAGEDVDGSAGGA